MIKHRPSWICCGLLALGLGLTTVGCKDDEGPSKLFEEDGAWSLVEHDVDGSGSLSEIPTNRKDTFMLLFNADQNVVTTAFCGKDGEGPTNALCDLDQESLWMCRCFAYAFVDDKQRWAEFAAGNVPPMVEIAEDDSGAVSASAGMTAGMSGGSGGGGTGGGTGGPAPGGGVTDHMVSLIQEVVGRAVWTPLPLDVFSSNGVSSRFVMQQRAPSVFARVFEDTERPTCQPCI